MTESGLGNIEALQKIVNQDPSAKKVMEALSKRQRFRKLTDLYQFRAQIKNLTGADLVQSDIIKIFKELQGAGIGKLVLKRGHSDLRRPRFEWRYNLRDVARVAGFGEPLQGPMSELTSVVNRAPSSRLKREGSKTGRPRGRPRVNVSPYRMAAVGAKPRVTKMIVSTIKIGPNTEVRIEYPEGISRSDAKRVAEFFAQSA